ncbi:Putative cyanovirin-N [Colletotrichum destructivum]|uniref:Cyanovirin-N n=1 Tax=Colletotrichum destructivum TaxID=34406 RepID=A0AAX4IHY7_9PEZI|nr:Putative cyanovirin-N [Colletotrichum destructivum]
MVKFSFPMPFRGLLLALSANRVIQAGFLDDDCGFINEGPQFTLRGDGSITTYCNDKFCSTVGFTVLNLNDCIANVVGDLRPKADGERGNFWKSCKDCYIEGSHIKCQCSRLDGSFKESSLDVNSIVFNWNGYLACHSQISNCYPMTWQCMPDNWWPEGWRPTVVDTPCDIWQAATMTPPNLTLPPRLKLASNLLPERTE